MQANQSQWNTKEGKVDSSIYPTRNSSYFKIKVRQNKRND